MVIALLFDTGLVLFSFCGHYLVVSSAHLGNKVVCKTKFVFVTQLGPTRIVYANIYNIENQ